MKKEREKEGKLKIKEGMLGGKQKRRTKGGGKGERNEKLVGKERKSGKRDGIGGANFIL